MPICERGESLQRRPPQTKPRHMMIKRFMVHSIPSRQEAYTQARRSHSAAKPLSIVKGIVSVSAWPKHPNQPTAVLKTAVG